MLHVGFDQGMKVQCAQQFTGFLALHALGREAEGRAGGLVGKAVAQAGVPVAHQRGQVVRDGAHIVLGLLQLLATCWRRCSSRTNSRPAPGGQHEKRRKAPSTQALRCQACVTEALDCATLQNQRVGAHMAEGIKALHTINGIGADEAATALGLDAAQLSGPRRWTCRLSASWEG